MTNQEQDLHTLLGNAFTILCNKEELNEEDEALRRHLEGRLENNSMHLFP